MNASRLSVNRIGWILILEIFLSLRKIAGTFIACQPNQTTSLYLWDAKTSVKLKHWFSISESPINNNNSYADRYPEPLFDIEDEFALLMDRQFGNDTGIKKPDELIMANKHKFNDTAFRREFFTEYFGAKSTGGRRLATFHDVMATNFGIIIDPNVCKRHVLNGGCISGHAKIFNFAHYPNDYDTVISLASSASGTWHFPMEVLMALQNVPPALLSTAIIHVPFKNTYIMNWLSLIPGLNTANVRCDPVVRAKTLLAPEMGVCAFPYTSQLMWLEQLMKDAGVLAKRGAHQNHVVATAHKSHIQMSEVLAAQYPMTGVSRGNIILVTRSMTRKVVNQEDVNKAVYVFAQQQNYTVILQDDKDLPSIRDQITRFSTADIVVMPHGAGGLFINFSPPGTCVVEFLQQSLWNSCYARIAFIKQLHYIAHMQTSDNKIDIPLLKSSMGRCMGLVQAEPVLH